MLKSINILTALGTLLFLLFPTTAGAVTGADWRAGNIIDDSVFYNNSDMSAADIHNFLNSKVNCDTWGTKTSEWGGGTRAQYGSSRGNPPPYTCLKDYTQDGKSAAQIIKEAADTYGISAKSLLVLIQKEQALVTDEWPWAIQYRSATGYGCPDTAPCDAEYYGFRNQVMKAAYQFRRYATYPNEYRYKPYQTNFIQYNPVTSCGGTNVFISNLATAGLYNYTPYQPNASALNNLYGSGDSCGAYGNRNFWRLFNNWFGSTTSRNPLILSRAYVNNSGWTNQTKDSGILGTTGQGKFLESISIQGEVEYSAYTEDTGWQPAVNLGMIAGSIDMNRPLKAVKIRLVGGLSSKYDIYYRAHVSNIGWMHWTRNYSTAGATGSAINRLEAIEIKLIPKGASGPILGVDAYRNISTASPGPLVGVSSSAHVSAHGWQPTITDTMISGTVKQKLAMEAIKLSVTNNTAYQGGISYSSHLAGIGWQNYVTNNAVSGTVKQSRQMEAIRINLNGELSEHYDIWYRAHSQDLGWMGWAKNNQPAGSSGAGKRLEALEIRIVAKNSVNLNGTSAFYNPKNKPAPATYVLTYTSHARDLGWLTPSSQGSISGTVKQSRRLEAIRLDGVISAYGDVSVICSAYAQGLGWVSENVPAGSTCGTTGQSKALQAIKLSLSGVAADKYDIQYQSHVSNAGWMDWETNDAVSGTPGSNQIEAIIVRLVPKN